MEGEVAATSAGATWSEAPEDDISLSGTDTVTSEDNEDSGLHKTAMREADSHTVVAQTGEGRKNCWYLGKREVTAAAQGLEALETSTRWLRPKKTAQEDAGFEVVKSRKKRRKSSHWRFRIGMDPRY
nr:PREDICTED: uncharacterized protein LOC106705682 [Latimeria chalumnae]|eukprot:XP_014351027.1 PREDICTED: uncharacterized protein LOC106705682 [Latimeria chalumnae]